MREGERLIFSLPLSSPTFLLVFGRVSLGEVDNADAGSPGECEALLYGLYEGEKTV